MKDSDLRWVAGSLAYSTVLSLVPFLALTVAVFQLIGGLDFLEPKVQGLFLQYFKEAVGTEAAQMVRGVLKRLKPETLGIPSLIFLVVASFRLLQDTEKGINKMWSKEDRGRSVLKRFLVSWVLLASFLVLLSVYLGFRSVEALQPLIKGQRGILDFLVLSLGLFLLYKWIPKAQVRSKSALIAGLCAGLGLVALQGSFAWITKRFFQISKIYGPLATVPLFLMWILFLWYVVLAGAALSASLDKSKTGASY